MRPSMPHLHETAQGGDLPDYFAQINLSRTEPSSTNTDDMAVSSSTSNGRVAHSSTKPGLKTSKQKFEWADLFIPGDLYPLIAPVGRAQRASRNSNDSESPRDYSPLTSSRWPQCSSNVRLLPNAQKNVRISTTATVPSSTAQTDDWNKAVNIWSDSFFNKLPPYEPQASLPATEMGNLSPRSLPSYTPRSVNTQTNTFLESFGPDLVTCQVPPSSPLYQTFNNCRRHAPNSSRGSYVQQSPASLVTVPISRGLPRSSKLLMEEQKGNVSGAGSSNEKADLGTAGGSGDDNILDRYFRQTRPAMLYNELSQPNTTEDDEEEADDDDEDDERLISITGLIAPPTVSVESTTVAPAITTACGVTVITTTANNDNNGIVSRSVTASKRKERIAERPNSS